MDSDAKGTSHSREDEQKRNIFGRFLDTVKDDLDFIPYKLLYGSIYGAGGCLIPYLPLYYKQLGFSAVETGVLVSIRPLCLAFISPIWGFLADRYKRRRLILFMGAMAWILKTMLILAVQPKHQECLVIPANSSLSKVELDENYLRPERRSLFDSNLLNRIFNWKMFTHTGGKKQPAIASPGLIGPTLTAGKNKKNCNISTSGLIFQRGLDIKEESKPDSLSHEASDLQILNTDEGEMVIIFCVLLALTLFGEIFSAMLHPIADGCLVDFLGEQRNLYGRVRLSSSLATSFGTLVIGLLINESTYCYFGQARKNYNIALYIFAVLMTVGLVSIFCVRIVYCCESATRLHYTKSNLRRKRLFGSLRLSLGCLTDFKRNSPRGS